VNQTGAPETLATAPTVAAPATSSPAEVGFGDIDYEKLHSFKAKGFHPSCIFDVGGSNGTWSRKIMPLFPQANFHIFEPLAEIASSYLEPIKHLIDTNENATLHKVAVGKESGTRTFNHREDNPSASTSIKVGNKSLYRQVRLPMVTLDSIIGAHSPIPDFIKIDIQGGELDVLKGCRSNLCKVQLLLLETWLSRGYGQNTPLLGELMNFLVPFGFHVFEVGDSWRNKNGSLISQDFYFVNECSPLASDFKF